MNRLKFLVFTLMVVVFASCSRDENTPSANEGCIDIQLTASDEMQEVASRAEESGVPEAGDFSLTIKNADGETIGSWEKFSEYDASTVVPVGEYTVSASYGDATAEGFDGLSYAGSSSANVTEGETTEVSVQCTINKARVSIAYTDAFKQYFSAYSASITSSHSNKVSFTADETRAAYFVPGNLDVYLDVTRPGASEKTTLKVKTLAAEVKHEYRLTMDVDAGTSTLKITFNDDPENTQNVEFDISDEALNAAPPVFMANGFTSGSAIEVVEGGSVEGALQAYLNASSGIASCTLATNSAALKALGWPESVDLVKMTAEQKQKMTELGLIVKGLGDNLDKIAIVEFQNVVPNLYCTGEGSEDHTFTLTATDVFGKVTETPVVLKITSRNNGFAVNLPESVPYGSSTMSFTMTLEGDASKVKFYYFAFGALQQFVAENVSISSEGTTHNVTLTYPEPLVDTENGVQFKAVYASKAIEKTVKVDDPELTLSLKNGDADVWATKAYVKVEASAKSRASRTISSSTVEIQYKDGEEWKVWPNQSYDNEKGLFLLTGMGESATETNGVAYTLRAAYKRGGEIVAYSGELAVITEAKAQVGNRGFEEWYSKELYSQSVLWAKNTIYGYYFWSENSDESLKWWDTTNTKTTPNPGGSSVWSYRSYSGVIPTSEEKYTASYHLRTRKGMSDLVTEGYKGNAVEIATVGWGASNEWWGESSAQPSNRTAGELYIGQYGETVDYGKTFSSRPSNIKFWYKYYSYNNESTTPYAKIFDENMNEIGFGSIKIKSSVYSFIEGNIELKYTSNKKAHAITIVFSSTDNDSPATMPVQGTSSGMSGYLDSRHIGSILTVDEVELVYE